MKRMSAAFLFAFFLVLAIAGLAVGIGRAQRKTDEVTYQLNRAREDVQRLNEEANNLQLQLQGIRELYENAAKDAADKGHNVSSDGKLEMFTWRNASGQICAHWCVHKVAGDGQCNEFGPDRCIP